MRQPRCDRSGRAKAGSQRQIQTYVNQLPLVLNRAIEESFARPIRLRWVSPLQSDLYREYRDRASLSVLGLRRHAPQLARFWPRNGPVWDALARLDTEGVLLIEAKSHIPEIYAATPKAKAPRSIQTIDAAFDCTKEWLQVDRAVDWRGKFSFRIRGREVNGWLYQMANRMAHLYFFREVLGIDAWLVNLCFIGDPRHPTSRADWETALASARANLGIGSVPNYAEIFLPAVG